MPPILTSVSLSWQIEELSFSMRYGRCLLNMQAKLSEGFGGREKIETGGREKTNPHLM